MAILYYDCYSGISGDMNLAAMIGLGVPEQHLRRKLAGLRLTGCDLAVADEVRNGIRGTRVRVAPPPKKGRRGAPQRKQPHRTLRSILHLMEESRLDERTRRRAARMFTRLAQAEAEVHGTTVDRIHFHEVGAVDSIVDIVGAAICLEYLKPDRVVSSPVELGSGLIRCDHGILPVPGPATAEILKNIPVRKGGQPFEATTPTGAVILACSVDEFTDRPSFRILKTAYGIGSRVSEVPNLLRVHLCEDMARVSPKDAYVIECNIDDMTPEHLGYAMEKFLEEGAADAFITPIVMKKNRSAAKVTVLCDAASRDKFISMILRETSTLGVRAFPVEKEALPRETRVLETAHGRLSVKVARLPDGKKKYKPEYEEIAAIARKSEKPVGEIYRDILRVLARLK